MLRFYHTSVAGGNVISRGGSWAAYDEADLDGTDGEAGTRTLYLAPAQTALTDAIASHSADDVLNIRVDHPVFDHAGYSIILINSEKFQITGGFGTRELSVVAGYDSTTAAEHSAEDAVYCCYDYQGITIGRTGDQASWLTFAAGASGGSFTSSLSPSNIDHDGSYTFRRKVTVPASTTKQRNQSATPTISFTAIEAEKS